MTARAQSQAIADKSLSPVELMDATLDRIDAANGAVNAVVSLRDRDALMAEAHAAQDAPRSGWLHGMPMAIKDLAHAKGLPTTMGSPLFADQIAQADEPAVARLRAAGAIIIGKTNTPEFGLGSHTYNPVHGVTRNPYDTSRSAGGSSGGAAVALATRMVSVADGSDMMGSLRNPAGWNNVYGARPQWGQVPSDPVGDVFMHQLATLGPMARNPGDLAKLLETMAGPLPGQPLCLRDPAQPLDAPAQMRLGWLGDWGGALPMEAGIMEISDTAITAFEGLGHRVSSLEAPFSADEMWHSWITLRSFAIGGGAHPLYTDADKRALLKPSAIWEIERGMNMPAMEVHRASAARSDWFRRCLALFEDVDVLVLPSAQCWPFDGALDHPTEVGGVAMDTYHRWMQVVVPASLIGLPVVNVPIGFGEGGLPAGLQLIGPPGGMDRLMALAEGWHQATDWPNARPPVI